MKIKKGFILRKVKERYIVIPKGENQSIFKGAIILNHTSMLLWNGLSVNSTIDDLENIILEQYPSVPRAKIRKDIIILLDKLRNNGLIDE
ncbi:PqqD family protein [uncultured Phascolarctobacterium sp.]|uniref:PqqD family protein n=1 Tax=uncultured Phascolarctobacterium sp. TaxID=512296 RepID=UPI0025D9473A|nr:PqqD family protein [uncultured Phascolarctobacterium sp.]